jgi:hypothetical protein
VSQKGTLFYFWDYVHLASPSSSRTAGLGSFAPPKEMNQRKGGRKRQPHPFCLPATHGLKGATKKDEVRTFSGSLSHILKA